MLMLQSETLRAFTPHSSSLIVSLNHVNKSGSYRLKCTIPLMCFHFFSCKDPRIATTHTTCKRLVKS